MTITLILRVILGKYPYRDGIVVRFYSIQSNKLEKCHRIISVVVIMAVDLMCGENDSLKMAVPFDVKGS